MLDPLSMRSLTKNTWLSLSTNQCAAQKPIEEFVVYP